MRSQKDPLFSSLCDRVARGKKTDEDEIFLKLRVQITESEQCNENFKNGNLSIIVTTNKKRNLVNTQKLAELISNEKKYKCNGETFPTRGTNPSCGVCPLARPPLVVTLFYRANSMYLSSME